MRIYLFLLGFIILSCSEKNDLKKIQNDCIEVEIPLTWENVSLIDSDSTFVIGFQNIVEDFSKRKEIEIYVKKRKSKSNLGELSKLLVENFYLGANLEKNHVRFENLGSGLQFLIENELEDSRYYYVYLFYKDNNSILIEVGFHESIDKKKFTKQTNNIIKSITLKCP